MNKILLVLIGLSLTLWAEMTRAGGVVTDSATGLEWQDDYSDNGGAVKTVNWKSAIEYCNTLSLDGGGWRLPNKNELLSIVDYTKTNPAIDTTVFENTTSRSYWSSTTRADLTNLAWLVYFYHGNSSYNDKYSNYPVRCVRSGQ